MTKSKPNLRAVRSTLEEREEISNMPSLSCTEFSKSRSLAWVEAVEKAGDDMEKQPPDCIVLYEDLVERGWGWKRLVPCSLGSVDWPDFKKYLVSYYKNTHKKDDELTTAVSMCINAENALIRNCLPYFSLEDFVLSSEINERAKQLLRSGCETSAAAAALLCITKEDELVCELSRCQCQVPEALTFANVIRRSASNFLLYKGSEYDTDAAAGIMLGMAREAESVIDSLKGEHSDAFVDFLAAENTRQCTVKALIKLEKELICKADDTDGNDTAMCAVDLNSKGKSKGGRAILTEKNSSEGNKRMGNKSPDNWKEAGEDVGTKLGLTGTKGEKWLRAKSTNNQAETGNEQEGSDVEDQRKWDQGN